MSRGQITINIFSHTPNSTHTHILTHSLQSTHTPYLSSWAPNILTLRSTTNILSWRVCLSGDGHRFFERAKFVREKGRCSEKKRDGRTK